MPNFDWEVRAFEDIAGNLRIIKPCPIRRLGELKQYLDLLQLAIAASPPSEDFASAYRGSKTIQATTREILTLCNISTDWVNLSMVTELIHHRRSPEGTFLPGILVEINFPQASDRKHSSTKATEVGLVEWIASTITALVGLGLAPDLERAISIADGMPWDELESYIITRQYQLNPKLRQHEQLEALNAQPPGRDDDFVLAAVSHSLENEQSDLDITKFL